MRVLPSITPQRVATVALLLPLTLAAQQRSAPRPPALSAIDTATLRRDMNFMASDAMRGREAGTLDELRASGWVAERARDAGLLPAGDDGTYFQWWPMRRIQTSERSTVALDGAPLTLWKEVAVASPVDVHATLPIVWVGDASADSIAKLHLEGKAVAADIVPPTHPPVSWISLRPWRYTGRAIGMRAQTLLQAGAAANSADVTTTMTTVAARPRPSSACSRSNIHPRKTVSSPKPAPTITAYSMNGRVAGFPAT